MSKFTDRYKKQIEKYGRAFINDRFANPTHQQSVDYTKLTGAELHTMMAYDKANHSFIIYAADNDDHEWFLFTRRRPMLALKEFATVDAPGYYDMDTNKLVPSMWVPNDIKTICDTMHTECEAD